MSVYAFSVFTHITPAREASVAHAAPARARGLRAEDMLVAQASLLAQPPTSFASNTRPMVSSPWEAGKMNASGLCKLLPAMENAASINSRSFNMQRAIDASSRAHTQAAIVSLPSTHRSWLEVKRNKSRTHAASLLDQLLLEVLPYIRLPHDNTRQLGLEDLVVFTFSLTESNLVPTIHWDGWWNCFPDSDGFQLWYMISPPKRQRDGGRVGNMFLVEMADSFGSDLPLTFSVQADGSGQLRLNSMGSPRSGSAESTIHPPIRHYADILQAGFKFRYIDLDEGEVVIMGKRHLHVTDLRPLLRRALSGKLAHHRARVNSDIQRTIFASRVIVRPRHNKDSISIWSKCPLFADKFANHNANQSARFERGYEQMKVERHTMMFW